MSIRVRVLVTRPEQQAHAWARQLEQAGLDARALPLIDIVAAPDPAAVTAAWAALTSASLVFFVSPNAVARFFDLRPAQLAWPPRVEAASPGPGTTEALQRFGVASVVAPPVDAEQFDSEALWQVLAPRDWQGRRVMIVRGTQGRDWLSQRFVARGAEVSMVAAYGRAAPQLTPAQQALLAEALVQPHRHVWLFSSSQAIDHLEALAPGADWSAVRAVATHPRIADRARALGMGRVAEARPAVSAVVGCIQSIAS